MVPRGEFHLHSWVCYLLGRLKKDFSECRSWSRQGRGNRSEFAGMVSPMWPYYCICQFYLYMVGLGEEVDVCFDWKMYQ